MALCPAPADTWIVFRRTDFGYFEIPVNLQYVKHVHYATVLIKDGIMVATVEHLLAALRGCGVDNVVVEIDSDEVPILDGSARHFVDMIRYAGIVELAARRKPFVVTAPVQYATGARSMELLPGPAFQVECTIDFDHPAIGRQYREVALRDGVFEREISAARTFVFQEEFEWRQRIGLLRGASPENSVVLIPQRILNRNGLRFPDEFVRHKILDVIGDLATFGRPVLGRVRATRSGHAIHNALLLKVANDQPVSSSVAA